MRERIPIKGSGFSIKIAASDASPVDKRNADYVCTGTADDVVIQRTIDSLTAFQTTVDGYWTTGAIELSTGTFNISANIKIRSGQSITGMGPIATNIVYSGTDSDVSGIIYDGNIGVSYDTAGAGFFSTIRNLGVWGNPNIWYRGGTGSRTGCGIYLDSDDNNVMNDCLVENCWSCYWPANGFSASTWNTKIVSSTAEYCGKYGFSGFHELPNCHAKYNRYGFSPGRNSKWTGGMFQKNFGQGIINPTFDGITIMGANFNANNHLMFGSYNVANSTFVAYRTNEYVSGWENLSGFGQHEFVDDLESAIFVEVADEGGGSLSLQLYKTDDGNLPPTFSNLVGHSSTFSGTGNITITADNASGWSGTLSVDSLPVAGMKWLMHISNWYDKYQRSEVDIGSDDARVIGCNLWLGQYTGTPDTEGLAVYMIRLQSTNHNAIIANNSIYCGKLVSSGIREDHTTNTEDTTKNNNSILGNTITGGAATYRGIDVRGKQTLVSNNRIIMESNSVAGYGIDYHSATDPYIQNNLIKGDSSTLTAGLNYGTNTDFSSDQSIIRPTS